MSAAANAGSSFRGWMQSTGQTSTHAVSFVLIHGSQIIYAIAPITIIGRTMRPVRRRAALFAAGLAVALGGARAAAAQALPSEPVTLAGGRLTLSGDVSATAGSEDPGFFNYTDYEHSALR